MSAYGAFVVSTILESQEIHGGYYIKLATELLLDPPYVVVDESTSQVYKFETFRDAKACFDLRVKQSDRRAANDKDIVNVIFPKGVIDSIKRSKDYEPYSRKKGAKDTGVSGWIRKLVESQLESEECD